MDIQSQKHSSSSFENKDNYMQSEVLELAKLYFYFYQFFMANNVRISIFFLSEIDLNFCNLNCLFPCILLEGDIASCGSFTVPVLRTPSLIT